MLKLFSAVLFVGLAFAIFDFARRMEPSHHDAKNAVVFTGQFNRVRLGLGLLEEGRVERLFISGVNRRSGFRPERFADQFSLSPQLRDAMVDRKLLLGVQANSTIKNAIETACWYRQAKLAGPLLLITGKDHMARASLALEGSLAQATIERLPVDEGSPPLSVLAQEFAKFLATRGYFVVEKVLVALELHHYSRCAVSFQP